MEDFEFESKKITLAPGEQIFLYTDGVTEAFNVDYVEFGEERLVNFLSEHQLQSSEDIVNESINAVAIFSGGAPQSDDITLLAIRYNG
jgi:sigma-B regulation protein RsbU (phosphoserine phosphatase)